jgi:hypothetical protein
MKTLDLIPLVDPALSPKYSPNLHTWLKHNKNRYPNVDVAVGGGGGMYVGAMRSHGWLSGENLHMVLCGPGNGHIHFLVPGLKLVPDFWDRYIRNGRCVIDPAHKVSFIGIETRWQVSGSARECLWCGSHVQVKLDWTETVEHSEWVAA